MVNTASDAWMKMNPAKTMTIYDIPNIVKTALPAAATPKNIQAGFQSTGIWPFNPDIFEECEYAGSQIIDRPDPGHSVTLFAAAGVGLCGVAVFLAVFFYKRRKRQTRNMNEPDYVVSSYSILDISQSVNTRRRTQPPDDDSCSVDDYENITKADLRAPSPDDDSSSAQDYVNVMDTGPSTPPADDYENIQGSGLSALPPDDDSSSVDDYVYIPSRETAPSAVPFMNCRQRQSHQ
ncbi:hypothetical protein SRHO_G00178830 [Serrasalmus rhombeus]